MSSDRSEMSIWDELHKRIRTNADRAAVITPTASLTFRELLDAADGLARKLEAIGVRARQTAVLALPNGPDFLIALLALFRIGVGVGLTSTKYSAAECDAIQAMLRPAGWITTAAGGLRVVSLPTARSSELSTGASAQPLVWMEPSAGETADRGPAAAFDSAVLYKFTSGSTGVPKGIALSAANLIAEGEQIASTIGITDRDRVVTPVPLFHSYGLDVGVLTSLVSGAALVLRDTFIPRRTWEDLAQKSNTVFLGVPSMYRLLLEGASPTGFDARHIRYALSCTAPLAPDLIRRFAERFGVRICQHYGSSESGAATNHEPASVLDRIESVGRPLHNVHARIVDEAGADVPAGREGELVLQSPAVALGYIGGHSSTTALADGVFRTGDAATMDEAGYIYIHGRRDDLINVGGLKVYPLEVAQALESHPAIREAAVAAMPLRSGEFAVYAAVMARETVTETELIEHCRSLLADYKVPRRIDLMDSLPRGPSGKVRIAPPGGSA